jgi:hypothetical protein
VICGNCKDRTASVEHVRDCYAGRTVQSAVTAQVAARPEPAAAASPVTEEGIYFANDTYFKVVESQEGRLYAKTWDGEEWAYDRGAIHRLTAQMRVTAEDAARFGRLTGTCVFCSRHLTDERSVTVGYGPKCADNNSLPWGEVGAP